MASGWSDWMIRARRPPTMPIGWPMTFQATESGPSSPSARSTVSQDSARGGTWPPLAPSLALRWAGLLDQLDLAEHRAVAGARELGLVDDRALGEIGLRAGHL